MFFTTGMEIVFGSKVIVFVPEQNAPPRSLSSASSHAVPKPKAHYLPLNGVFSAAVNGGAEDSVMGSGLP